MPLFERVHKILTGRTKRKIRQSALKLEDRDWLVRLEGIDELKKIKHPAIIPHLVRTLRDHDVKVREVTAQALAEVKSPDAISPLVQALKDEERTVRGYAALALGEIGRIEPTHQLTHQLQDRDQFAHQSAALALGKIGRAIRGQKVETEEERALQLVGKHFHEEEDAQTVHKAYLAALEGKITDKNAKLYIKQLRAVKGKVK